MSLWKIRKSEYFLRTGLCISYEMIKIWNIRKFIIVQKTENFQYNMKKFIINTHIFVSLLILFPSLHFLYYIILRHSFIFYLFYFFNSFSLDLFEFFTFELRLSLRGGFWSFWLRVLEWKYLLDTQRRSLVLLVKWSGIRNLTMKNNLNTSEKFFQNTFLSQNGLFCVRVSWKLCSTKNYPLEKVKNQFIELK